MEACSSEAHMIVPSRTQGDLVWGSISVQIAKDIYVRSAAASFPVRVGPHRQGAVPIPKALMVLISERGVRAGLVDACGNTAPRRGVIPSRARGVGVDLNP